ncbi:MAG: hypothetical protein D6826_05200 [Alphaproteobacteria bacterium]|nr:MAG: hypothetical protein D6826_05200 [Alphaproteobacteria bacterium]
MRRWPLRSVAVIGLALLGACTSAPPPPCPSVVGVPGARNLVRFNGPGRDLTDVAFEAAIQRADVIACEVDDNVLTAEMQVTLRATRGPADIRRMAPVRYFVAIATRDRKVLAREEFALDIPFEGNRTNVLAVDELEPRIPRGPDKTGADYVLYVGLVLTPEEFRYNRENGL